jgi:membrane associated rhomboid family serine protease
MLEDRSYMRDPMFRWNWPAYIILMVANVAVFALQEINRAYMDFPMERYLALSHEGLRHGYVWQLFTFQFLHGGLWHLAFNLIGIYFFGRFVEDRLGRTRFLKLYFLSGTCGGVLQALLSWPFPHHFGMSLVGASAGVYGLITVFALLDPEGVILLFFFLPMRAKYFVAIAAAIALFYILVPAGTSIAHAAHLGGILGGLAFLRWKSFVEAFMPVRRLTRSRLRARELMRVPANGLASWRRSRKEPATDVSATDFISREVDPILDKISKQGIQSLTPREREILEAARAKMEKRNREG